MIRKVTTDDKSEDEHPLSPIKPSLRNPNLSAHLSSHSMRVPYPYPSLDSTGFLSPRTPRLAPSRSSEKVWVARRCHGKGQFGKVYEMYNKNDTKEFAALKITLPCKNY